MSQVKKGLTVVTGAGDVKASGNNSFSGTNSFSSATTLSNTTLGGAANTISGVSTFTNSNPIKLSGNGATGILFSDSGSGDSLNAKIDFNTSPLDGDVNGELTIRSHVLKLETANVSTGASSLVFDEGVGTFRHLPKAADASNNDITPSDNKELTPLLYVNNKDAENVKKTGNQDIAGVKTFESLPLIEAADGSEVTPGNNPKLLVTKGYVDSTFGGGGGIDLTVMTTVNNFIKRIDQDFGGWVAKGTTNLLVTPTGKSNPTWRTGEDTYANAGADGNYNNGYRACLLKKGLYEITLTFTQRVDWYTVEQNGAAGGFGLDHDEDGNYAAFDAEAKHYEDHFMYIVEPTREGSAAGLVNKQATRTFTHVFHSRKTTTFFWHHYTSFQNNRGKDVTINTYGSNPPEIIFKRIADPTQDGTDATVPSTNTDASDGSVAFSEEIIYSDFAGLS